MSIDQPGHNDSTVKVGAHAVFIDCSKDGKMDAVAVDYGSGHIDTVAFDTNGDGIIDVVKTCTGLSEAREMGRQYAIRRESKAKVAERARNKLKNGILRYRFKLKERKAKLASSRLHHPEMVSMLLKGHERDAKKLERRMSTFLHKDADEIAKMDWGAADFPELPDAAGAAMLSPARQAKSASRRLKPPAKARSEYNRIVPLWETEDVFVRNAPSPLLGYLMKRIRLKIPPMVETVEELVKACPGECAVSSKLGFLPLHFVIQFSCPRFKWTPKTCSLEVDVKALHTSKRHLIHSPLGERKPVTKNERRQLDFSLQHVNRLCKAILTPYPAALHHRDKDGNNMLHYAAAWGASPAQLLYLLHTNPRLPEQKNNDGRLPLHTLMTKKDCCIENVIALTTLYPDAVMVMDKYGELPIHLAIQYGVGSEGIGVLLEMKQECGDFLHYQSAAGRADVNCVLL